VGVASSADSVNHLAVATFSSDDQGDPNPTQLASYTVDGSGNIASTNTYKNMPTPDVNVNSIQLSPSGQFLAVASNSVACLGCNTIPGLQVFQFNGANPMTALSGILTNAPIDFIAWDEANHLYVVSDYTMYVYSVSATTITAAPGSPFLINAGPNGRDSVNALVVVPK
jgi:WD40 repeat protein